MDFTGLLIRQFMITESELYPVLNILDVLGKLGVYQIDNYWGDGLVNFATKFCKSTRIVFVGLNPSEESPDNSAFHPITKSGKAVRSWLNNNDGYIVKFVNLTHHKNSSPHKPINSKLSMPTIIKFMADRGYRIITCGTVADTILKKNGIKHFAMPHPSGLNRFWNDKVAGEAKIKEMLEWIKNGN